MRSLFFLYFFVGEFLSLILGGAPTFATPSVSSPLPFEAALESILNQHPTLAEKSSQKEALQARNLPSRLFFLPTVSLKGVAPWQSSSPVFSLQNEFLLESKWNLFRGGSDFFLLRSNQWEEKAQDAQQEALLLQLEGEAMRALISFIQKKKETQIHTQMTQTRSELLKIAQERYQQGYLPLQEVEKLEVDLENAKANLSESHIRDIEAHQTLVALLGHAEIEAEWPWISLLKAQNQMQTSSTSFLSLSSRPDWLATQHQVEAKSNQVQQARRLYLPSIDAQVMYGLYGSKSDRSWMGQLTFTLPLFDHLVTYSQVQEGLALKASAEYQAEKIQRAAKKEYEISRHSFTASIRTAITREKNLILSRKLYQDNLKRFQAGKTHSNDLSLDENRMYQTELLSIQGWGNTHLHYSELCHAQGKRLKECSDLKKVD